MFEVIKSEIQLYLLGRHQYSGTLVLDYNYL